jgi:malonyl-CoA O-methyltransferase
VLSALVLEHLADLGPFFSEARRIGRPGARFVLSALHPDMFKRGVRARFIDPSTGRKTFMHSIDHRIDDVVGVARNAGWRLERLVEEGPDDPLCRDFPDIEAYRDCRLLLAMKFTMSLDPSTP